MHTLPDDRTILGVLEPLALAAGSRIMEIRARGFEAEAKADSSPVTQADRDAEAIILAGLRERFPGVAIIAEEEASVGLSPETVGDVFFLIDPLDGTKEFVKGGTDFTVNIALVRACEPVVGVVYAPAANAMYSGAPGIAEMVRTDGAHQPVDRRAIGVREGSAPLTIVASRSHNTPETDAFIGRYEPADRVTIGSSLKFCLVASGEADLYPRFGRTMQWDTAAGDAVLRAAGGMTRTLDGEPFRYGHGTCADEAPFANPFFVAEGRVPRG
jgi:3'(2'), 5'-bisphosphate nucleotidase